MMIRFVVTPSTLNGIKKTSLPRNTVIGRDVAGEGVEAVGPPEAGAVVVVEAEDLLGQRLARSGADGQVAVEDVVDLGAVLEEEAVPHAPLADVVADDQVIGAVNRQPAIVDCPRSRRRRRSCRASCRRPGGSAGCSGPARLPCRDGGTRRS